MTSSEIFPRFEQIPHIPRVQLLPPPPLPPSLLVTVKHTEIKPSKLPELLSAVAAATDLR